jgi:polyphosphate kinase
MPRNFDGRIELLVPVDDAPSRKRLIAILNSYLRDNVKGRLLLPDGSYRRLRPSKKKPAWRSQERLYEEACQAIRLMEKTRRVTFEPYRAEDHPPS